MEFVMVNIIKALILILPLYALVGCPTMGDRFKPNETTTVSEIDDAVCFYVSKSNNYQPTSIIISPIKTPIQKREFIYEPNLTIKNNQMCISESFYKFSKNGKYYIDYVLTSNKKSFEPRRVVLGLEFTNGIPSIFKLNSNE
jgi:hypothetical protein